jgi:hypothetical protein
MRTRTQTRFGRFPCALDILAYNRGLPRRLRVRIRLAHVVVTLLRVTALAACAIAIAALSCLLL